LLLRRPVLPPTIPGKLLARIPGDPFGRTLAHHLKELVRLGPDLVVVTVGSSSVWEEFHEVFGGTGIPYVLVVQAANDRCWFEDGFREKLAQTYREAREVFYVSEGNRALVNAQLALPEDRGQVVFNPFSVPYEPGLAWPDGTEENPRFAFVGRLEPESKGCDLILEVLARPHWRARAPIVNFFGAGPCERGVRELAELRGLANVSFPGFSRNVVDIWRTHHALLLPSRYEGMPLAMIEAMLCGRVCVVTNVAGNAELMEDNVSGFVAASATIEHLDEAMERAWSARARWQEIGRLAGEAARARVPRAPGETLADRLEALV